MSSKHPVVPEEPAPQDERGELQLSAEMRSLADRLTTEARALGELVSPVVTPPPRPAAKPASVAAPARSTRGGLLALAILLAVSLAFFGGWEAATALAPSQSEQQRSIATAPQINPAEDVAVKAPAGVLPAVEPVAEFRPRRDAQPVGRAVYSAPSAPLEVRELLAPSGDELDDAALGAAPVNDEEKISLLETALERYRSAIVYLQQRLSEREQEQMHNRQIIDSLQNEVDALRKQLQARENLSDAPPE